MKWKDAFKMKWKPFSMTFKGLSMKQITHFFLEGESSNLNKKFLLHFQKFWSSFFKILILLICKINSTVIFHSPVAFQHSTRQWLSKIPLAGGFPTFHSPVAFQLSTHRSLSNNSNFVTFFKYLESYSSSKN